MNAIKVSLKDHNFSTHMGWLAGKIELKDGLIGFPETHELEIFYIKEEAPFFRLKSGDELEMIAIDLAGFFEDYTMEISGEDLSFLKIRDQMSIVVLNLVTIREKAKNRGLFLTVNLVAPIIINKNTHQARQVIIENYQKYSVKHVIYSE